MSLSKCVSLSVENKIEKSYADVDSQINETGHGTQEFPVAIYLDNVSSKYVNWHWHEEFEIGFVTEGAVLLGCGNRRYQLEREDIFFINSNVLHSMYNSDRAGQAVFKSIAFHSSIISESLSSVFYTKYLLPVLSGSHFRECIITKDRDYYRTMLDSLSKVWDLLYSEPPYFEIKARNELSTLFCTLNQFQKDTKETLSSKVPNYLPEKRVQVLLDYIHTHYRDKITIEDLAKTASISKTEVIRCFKSIIGISPINYLNSYRLQSAAYMLINTEKNIQEIADDCGFDDNSYFSKCFKKKYLVSPYNYRRQNQIAGVRR